MEDVKAQVFRTFRVARILRLVNKATTLNILFNTFVFSIPSLSNVAITVFIIYYIFSVVGMNIFSDVDTSLSRLNFHNFSNSLYTLYVSSTADSWSIVVGASLDNYSNRYVVIAFWIAFFLIGALVMLNLFIGVVLEVFSMNDSDSRQVKRLSSVFKLQEGWNRQDRKATKLITADKFWALLLATPYPTGFTMPNEKDDNPIGTEAFLRFVQIMEKHQYIEPETPEVLRHLEKIKLIPVVL